MMDGADQQYMKDTIGEFEEAEKIDISIEGCSRCEEEVIECNLCDNTLGDEFYCDGFGEHRCKRCNKK